MLAILKKEMRSYFNTLTGYIFLGFFVLVTGFYFSFINILGGSPYYNQTLSYTLTMFLILIPVMTMKLFSEESRQKTDQLLYTSPISIFQIVIGKFLAASCLFIIAVLITSIFPFILSIFGNIPKAEIIGGIIGYTLMGLCFISIGLFISVLTDNQIISAVGTFAAMFLIFMIDGIANSMPVDTSSSVIFICIIITLAALFIYNNTKNILAGIIFAVIGYGIVGIIYYFNRLLFDGIIVKILGWFSLLKRFDNFFMGIFSFSDVVYYITFAAVFLFLAINVIEKRKWN